MNKKDFEKIVNAQIQQCAAIMLNKANEYASADEDRLAHFKRAGALQECEPETALMGMFAKHLVSVTKMCIAPENEKPELWLEKITDSINYLLLLRALVEERYGNEKH